MGEEKNSLLYVDSSSVRKARRTAENKMRASGGEVKGNHNSTSKKSVGRGLINSHMDRLEVGSDGRLFHVKETKKPRPAKETSNQTAQQNLPIHEDGTPHPQAETVRTNLPAMQAVKPARPYLSADYRNPLLTVTDTKAKPVFGREIFRRYRTQILAAAVADYTPAETSEEKIHKQEGDAMLELKRTQDILATLGEHKPVGQILVGFSMETENAEQRSLEKLKKKHCDYIVSNNVKEPGAGFAVDTNKVTIFSAEGKKELGLLSKEETAEKILAAVSGR